MQYCQGEMVLAAILLLEPGKGALCLKAWDGFFDRSTPNRSRSLPGSLSSTPDGRKLFIANSACGVRITRQQYDRWRSSGRELSFGCGSVGYLITSEPIWPRYRDAARHCGKCWLHSRHR